jgi:hypothetical protein
VNNPEYDSDLTGLDGYPTEKDFTTRILDFLASSPVVGIITGTHVEASGDCSSTGEVWGTTFSLSLCEFGGVFGGVGTALVGLAGLWAVAIAFGYNP